MVDLIKLKDANVRRWNAAELTRGPEFLPVARRLVAAKQRYMNVSVKTGIPWPFIAVTHQRESSQNWNRSLAQGDPWNQVSAHVPAGRGPFMSWEDAAYDALVNCAPHAARNKDWSIGGLLTLLEQYNGTGYAAKGVPSPYIWSGTDQYKSGKYVADHVYDANAVDKQLGCAGLIMAMMSLDPSIKFDGAAITQTSTLPPPKKPVSTSAKAGTGAVIVSTAGTIAVGVQQGWGVLPWIIAGCIAAGIAGVVYLIRKADK
jgi:lysozyme family protein